VAVMAWDSKLHFWVTEVAAVIGMVVMPAHLLGVPQVDRMVK
jgi:hypothetical protein